MLRGAALVGLAALAGASPGFAAGSPTAQGSDAPSSLPAEENTQQEAEQPAIGLPTAAETHGRTRSIPGPSERPDAEAPAIDLFVIYTFDIWRNARGGVRRGWRYLDNLDMTLTIDTERAIGWRDATLFIYGLYNNGRALSEELIGDAQGAANIETGVRALRLYEAWVEQRFGRASVKLGLYDLNSEFDEHRTGSLFLNSTHGLGPDLSQSGLNGPSVFPVTSLALRVDYQINEQWRVRAAILDAVPGNPSRPGRTAIRLRDAEGALLIGEAQYQNRNTRAILGYWRYTAGFVPVGPASAPGAQRGNDGLYMMVEQQLSRSGADGARGLAGWLRLGLASDRFNPIVQDLSGGLVYTAPFAARPADQVGVAFSRARFGAPYRAAMALAATPSTRSEISLEASYLAVLTPWLSVRPDVQYIINPGGNPGLPDAVVLGLRAQVGF